MELHIRVTFDGTLTLDGLQAMVDRAREVGYPEVDMGAHTMMVVLRAEYSELRDSIETLDPELRIIAEAATKTYPFLKLEAFASVISLHERFTELRDQLSSLGICSSQIKLLSPAEVA